MKRLKPKLQQTALYIFLLAAVVAAMSLSRRCNAGEKLAVMTQGDSKGDTIDAAIIYGPLSYYIYADTLGGLNYDLLRLFSEQSGRPVKFWPVVTLDDALRKLEDGTFDILASLPSDNSLKSRFLTTKSIFLDRLVLIQLTDSAGDTRIKSALDLAGDTVYIQAESPAASRLRNMSAEIGDTVNVIGEKNLSEEYLCMKVAKGEIPLAVVNENIARAMKGRYPLLSYDNPVSFTQFQVWLINRNDTALQSLTDRWLDSISSSPSYRRITERYIP